MNQEKKQQHNRLTELTLSIEDRLNRLDTNIETHYNQAAQKISSNDYKLKSLAQTIQAGMQEIGKAETEESEVNLFHLVKHLDNSQLSNEKNLQGLENDISSLSLQIIPDNCIENVDAMFSAFSPDPRTMIFKSQSNSNKVRQSQLHIHPHEIQFLDQTRIFHSDKSSRLYACCFFDENKVLIIEEQLSTELRYMHMHGRIGGNRKIINLRIMNLKDGKYNSFNIRLLNDVLCKDTVCTFDRNNTLLVGKTSVFVIDLESKTIGRTIQLGIPIQGCKWITCIKSEIVVLCQKSIKQEKADFISCIDYNGVSLRTLDLPGNVFDLDIYETRVYCTFNNANHVTCTSFDGETNTCYTSLDLRESCKIAVGESMIFLLEKDRNSIYTIDIKTKQRSTFLKDEIINPTHMVLNRKTKELAVTCDGGNCLKIFNTHI